MDKSFSDKLDVDRKKLQAEAKEATHQAESKKKEKEALLKATNGQPQRPGVQKFWENEGRRGSPRHGSRERLDLREATVAVAKDGGQPLIGADAEEVGELTLCNAGLVLEP